MGHFTYVDGEGNLKTANDSKGFLVSSVDPEDQIAEFKLFTTTGFYYATKYIKYFHLTRKNID